MPATASAASAEHDRRVDDGEPEADRAHPRRQPVGRRCSAQAGCRSARGGAPADRPAARRSRGSRRVTRRPVEQPVAAADDGLDERVLVVDRQLAAQRADRDPHGVGERIGVLVPHVLEQRLLGQHLAGVGHEVAQEGELLGREVERRDRPVGASWRAVSSSRSPTASTGGGRAGVAPQQRAHPGQQLGEGERLHQVVVGAVVEPGDPVVERCRGR